MNNFSEISLCRVLQSSLAKQGFVQPTPVQAQAIPPALAGRDVVATAQTGTGKTLAFLLPMLQSLAQGDVAKGIRALILTPTRELALQIHEAAAQLTTDLGIRSTVVVGGMSEVNQLRSLRKGCQIVIATPGRLCDFLDRKLIDLGGVHFLVLDEADRMLDMGFLPSLRVILKTMPSSRQTLLFSATIEKSVAHLIDSHVRNPIRISIGATKPAGQVKLFVYEVEQDRKLGLLTKLLSAEKGSFLVFVRTKHGTDRLAKSLDRVGLKAARIHGNRSQSQRNEALRGFQNGTYRILVATDVAARGIHVDDIAHVVNYDLPQVPEDFVHRVGRTGRAGAHGSASTFSTRSERGEIRKIESALSVRMTPLEAAADVIPRPLAQVINEPRTAAGRGRSPGPRSESGRRRDRSRMPE